MKYNVSLNVSWWLEVEADDTQSAIEKAIDLANPENVDSQTQSAYLQNDKEV